MCEGHDALYVIDVRVAFLLPPLPLAPALKVAFVVIGDDDVIRAADPGSRDRKN